MPMFNHNNMITVIMTLAMSAAFLGGTLVVLDSIMPPQTASITSDQTQQA